MEPGVLGPLEPSFQKQRQEDLYEIQARQVYIATSRQAGATGRLCLKSTKKRRVGILTCKLEFQKNVFWHHRIKSLMILLQFRSWSKKEVQQKDSFTAAPIRWQNWPGCPHSCRSSAVHSEWWPFRAQGWRQACNSRTHKSRKAQHRRKQKSVSMTPSHFHSQQGKRKCDVNYVLTMSVHPT